MRIITAALMGLAGLAMSQPSQAMSADEAQHLLLRTGFGATDAELQALEAQPYDRAVRQLVSAAAQHTQALTPPPDWVDQDLPQPRKLKNASPEQKKAYVRQIILRGLQLQGWWIQEMVNTPDPLAEQMTLFWHDHFTSGLKKVKSPVLMYRQNLTLRRYALGNFRDFLHAIARDPAMILYLDNQTNRDGHPNENFARELMELFTLGQGQYSETDVKQAARAFTGWSIRRPDGHFHESWWNHDGGEKIFLGHRGDLDGDNVIDIILAQPQTARFIVEKLWRYYVSPDPDAQQVQRLAAQFRADYEIAPLMVSLLETPQFRAASDRGTIAKSPVDLVAGTLRSLGVHLYDGRFPAVVCDRLGQALFNPPNVKGWPGGDAWIDSQTLVAREQFLDSLSRGFNAAGYGMAPASRMEKVADRAPPSGKGDASGGMRARLAAQLAHAAQSLDMERYLGAFAQTHDLQQAETVLLAIPPVQTVDAQAGIDTQLRALLLDPAYQLK